MNDKSFMDGAPQNEMETISDHLQRRTRIQKKIQRSNICDSESQDHQRTQCANPESMETPDLSNTTHGFTFMTSHISTTLSG